MAEALTSTYYVSHGAPTLPLDDCPARDFLKEFPSKFLPNRIGDTCHEQLDLPELAMANSMTLFSLVMYESRPKAILAISAHWDTREPSVNAVSKNSTIHDFYGFPPELYQLQYTPPGAPELARRVKSLLQGAGFKTVHEDKKRGLDHGAWVPLMLMYPGADIPVCQLSIQSHKDGAYHFRLGRALASLKDEGVLVLASGSAVHNLREMDFSGSLKPTVWSKGFDDWLTDALVKNRPGEVVEWEKAPYARRAHPHPDHFVPLLVALGAAGENLQAEKIHSSFMFGLSMAGFAFHSAGSSARS